MNSTELLTVTMYEALRGRFRYLPQQGTACTQHHTTLETIFQPSKELAIAATKSVHQTGLTSLSHTNRERAITTCTKLAKLHYQCRIKRSFTSTGMVATTKSDTATTKTKPERLLLPSRTEEQ
ncbi:hypothetical protein DY000_02045384 [Brassica cretica]|uniref:Uncharacterized protein n=1 Tax=Brassica cretica TaxID=69181 RepID=A0ABQ7EPK1_BRACR|nr:hypothetical protein DY000_02045384 [Brassica cretica]